MRIFANLITAETYDQICNKPPIIDIKNITSKNANFFGTQQMLAGRIGGLQHKRFPEKSVDELVEKLIAVRKRIYEHAADTFQKEGCASEVARKSEKSLKLFTEVASAAIYGLIDQTIIKEGGTITSMEELDAKIPAKAQ